MEIRPLQHVQESFNFGSGVLGEYVQNAVTAEDEPVVENVSGDADSRSNLGLAAKLQLLIFESLFDENQDSPSSDVFRGANRLIALLPVDLPDPEVDLGANGQVIFEWINTENYRFAISVINSSKFSFAGLYNHRNIYGSDFLRNHIQDTIVDGIQRAFSST